MHGGGGGATPRVPGRHPPPPPREGASGQQLVVKGMTPRSQWAKCPMGEVRFKPPFEPPSPRYGLFFCSGLSVANVQQILGSLGRGGGDANAFFCIFLHNQEPMVFLHILLFFCFFLHMFCLQFPFNITIHGQICVTWCCK